MNKSLTSANISFNHLSNSKEFLNIVLNNICNAILMLNKDMELQAFNDTLKTLFVNYENEYLLYKRCGEAIGCANTVEEKKRCGDTTKCHLCNLREAALISYTDKKAVYREKITIAFYRTNGDKVNKVIQFSTRPFYFEDEYYIIMIIEDITMVMKKDELICKLQNKHQK